MALKLSVKLTEIEENSLSPYPHPHTVKRTRNHFCLSLGGYNKNHRLDVLKNKIFHNSGDRKSEIGVLEDSVSGEGPLPSLYPAVFSC